MKIWLEFYFIVSLVNVPQFMDLGTAILELQQMPQFKTFDLDKEVHGFYRLAEARSNVSC